VGGRCLRARECVCVCVCSKTRLGKPNITLRLAFNEGLLNKTIPQDVYLLSIEVVHVCKICGFRSGGNEHLESPSI